jgi:hypothetical protein
MWQFGPLTTYPLRTVFQNPCQSLNPDVAIACDPANQQAGQYRYDQLPVIYLMVPSSAPSTAPPVEATPSIDRLIQPDPSYYQTSPVDHSYLSKFSGHSSCSAAPSFNLNFMLIVSLFLL